jgi:hypothetical protein
MSSWGRLFSSMNLPWMTRVGCSLIGTRRVMRFCWRLKRICQTRLSSISLVIRPLYSWSNKLGGKIKLWKNGLANAYLKHQPDVRIAKLADKGNPQTQTPVIPQMMSILMSMYDPENTFMRTANRQWPRSGVALICRTNSWKSKTCKHWQLGSSKNKVSFSS